MGLLKSVETTIANLLEGTFGRVFRSEVRPMELARKLAREMDAHRTHSVSQVYVPNEYAVWLSPRDRERYEGIEQEVVEELCAYLLEHARREDLAMSSPPHVSFHTDERLSLGEFGIQARLVRADAPEHAAALAGGAPAPERHPAPEVEDEHGQTMIYSGAQRLREPIDAARAQPRPPRALLLAGGRRLLLPPQGGVIGRSRDSAVVLEDSGVSRRHAELRPAAEGWTLVDLGSTNGVLVNGRALQGAQLLAPGDRLELGSTQLVFELQ
jgi:hypothetical protein